MFVLSVIQLRLKMWNKLFSVFLSQTCFCKAGGMAWKAKDALGHAFLTGFWAGAGPSRLLAEASTWGEQAARSSRAGGIANQGLISWCSFPMLWKTRWLRSVRAKEQVRAIGLAFGDVLFVTGGPEQDLEHVGWKFGGFWSEVGSSELQGIIPLPSLSL